MAPEEVNAAVAHANTVPTPKTTTPTLRQDTTKGKGAAEVIF